MERDPIDPRIVYEWLTDPSPSAANGSFQGFQWDFYARWDNWHFALSTDSAIIPDAAEFRELESARLSPGIFFREGPYGERGQSKASYMTIDEKRRIIRECIHEFESGPTK